MNANTDRVVTFLKGLRRESGAYADSHTGEGNLRATLSVLKALGELGELEIDPQTVEFIRQCHNDNGSFSSQPGGDPSTLLTAAGLIALKTARQDSLLAAYLPAATRYMSSAAANQYDHFMLIAAYEECSIADPVPAASIEFFGDRLETTLAASNVVDAAIAAASLIRAGQTLQDPERVARLMLAGQNTPDGGMGDGGQSTLFGTYCVMRTLALLGVQPNTRQLLAYFDSLDTGHGYADVAGGPATAGSTYSVLSMWAWIRDLQRIPVDAARDGNVDVLDAWLRNGGDPNLYDRAGWTALLAASARGQAAVVDLLLNHSIPGAPKADPSIRFQAADALPIYMAGQAGDLETVLLLLKAEPAHLHAISRINGHTVLLQAAFYGKEKHLRLAAHLLDHAAEISHLPSDQLAGEQARLLSATNVRGYNALNMQDLWHNEQMKRLLLRYYPEGRAETLEAQRQQYYADLLLTIATPQALTERMMNAIAEYLESEDTSAIDRQIDTLLAHPSFEINRRGGALQQTPLILAITGVDVSNPARAKRRYALAHRLLDAGADPAVREVHPMAVGAVIRASVLNNFGLLKLIADHMSPEAFAEEMNTSPAVNGLTAMHDAVHRALTSPPAELAGHLDQITWMIAHGARLDIPDHTGQTQRALAEAAQHDPAFPADNVKAVLVAINAA